MILKYNFSQIVGCLAVHVMVMFLDYVVKFKPLPELGLLEMNGAV